MTVKPINQSRQRQVVAATTACILRAEQLFERDFLLPHIRFDLSGRIAGMYRLRHQQHEIRYNPYLFEKYFDDNLANTVPHEVAHYLVAEMYGWRNIRPHGTQWQAVMLRLGVAPQVTCRYDLSDIPQRRQRRPVRPGGLEGSGRPVRRRPDRLPPYGGRPAHAAPAPHRQRPGSPLYRLLPGKQRG